MTMAMIIALLLLVAGFIIVLGLMFALFINADIIPGLFVAGLCVFVAMLVALPFMHFSA